MVDDNRLSEHCICRNADDQQDRDHDRRNEIFHGPMCPKRTELPAPTWVLGSPGRRRSGSQHAYEDCRPKGEAGEDDNRLQKFLALRIGLLPSRRGRPLVFWQKLNQSPADR